MKGGGGALKFFEFFYKLKILLGKSFFGVEKVYPDFKISLSNFDLPSHPVPVVCCTPDCS